MFRFLALSWWTRTSRATASAPRTTTCACYLTLMLIDLGDPNATVTLGNADGHLRILCGRIEMGAFEFGVGDFDSNGLLNLTDLPSWPACLTGPDDGPRPAGREVFAAAAEIALNDVRALQLLCLEP